MTHGPTSHDTGPDLACNCAQALRTGALIGAQGAAPAAAKPHRGKVELKQRSEKEDAIDADAFLKVLPLPH